MMLSMVLHPSDPQGVMSPSSLVGLNAVPAKEVLRGRYRTYLDSQVREKESLESEPVKILYSGSLVFVVEARGSSVRILKPMEGWMSMMTEDGIETLRPDMTYNAPPDTDDMEAVFRSRHVREANKRLQQSAAKLTAVQ